MYAPPAVRLGRLAEEGRKATAMVPGDRVRVGAIEVTAVPADHDGRRVPVGVAAEAIGFVLGGGVRVYFAGDTDLFDGMRELARRARRGAAAGVGLGPEGRARAPRPRARRARGRRCCEPRLAIPVHWGTSRSPRVWWREDPELPAREFERHVAAHAPGVAVAILAPGGSVPLRPAAAAAR